MRRGTGALLAGFTAAALLAAGGPAAADLPPEKPAPPGERVLSEEKPVGLLYRERPFSHEDSGWRIFEGRESGAFVADPENVAFCPLQAIIELEPALENLLDRKLGTAFERGPAGDFVDVSDPETLEP